MADVEWVKVAVYVSAGLCMGLGTLGPSLGQGFVGGKACESIGKNPESAGFVRGTMFIALAIIESTAVYALLISLMLMFGVPK